jgi:hypothetical protein
MEDEKSNSPDEDFGKIVNNLWAFALEHGGKSWDLYPLAVLVRSVERLKLSTEESSKQANLLSSSIRKLNRWLVGLTAAAVILTALSLYVLFTSAK